MSRAASVPSHDHRFEFTQGVASSTWVVNHPLNCHPSVTITDSAKNVVIGKVQYIDNYNLIITFNATFSGKAFLN